MRSMYDRHVPAVDVAAVDESWGPRTLLQGGCRWLGAVGLSDEDDTDGAFALSCPEEPPRRRRRWSGRSPRGPWPSR